MGSTLILYAFQFGIEANYLRYIKDIEQAIVARKVNPGQFSMMAYFSGYIICIFSFQYKIGFQMNKPQITLLEKKLQITTAVVVLKQLWSMLFLIQHYRTAHAKLPY